MPWWLKNNLRLIQNNMRDVDGAMDVDSLVQTLKEFHCNVARVGAGGITSFYPTELEFQWPSPYLNGRDLLGEIVKKCHAAGIRVIGRFDFSKTHEKFYPGHEEWYFKNAQGGIIHYNDTVQTCLSGWYQQQYSLEILKEALAKYPLDGVFFNMFGFHSWDYSGNQYGVCHCDACKARFAEFTGGKMTLPESERADEPAHQAYEAFKRASIRDIMLRIQSCVRSFGAEIAVCTSNPTGVDIIHNESNSALERPLPQPLMMSSSNVAMVRHNFPDKIVSNCVINAADLWWRFTGVSEELTAIRLYENIAQGSGLDYCIIGVFDGYPDMGSVERAMEAFRFHAENEQYYGHLESQAKLAVVQPLTTRPVMGGGKEYHGVFRALKEEHIPFDVISDVRILENPAAMARYAAAIFPSLDGVDAAAIPALRRAGVKCVVTGLIRPLPEEAAEKIGLQITAASDDTKGAYLCTREKDVFKHFLGRDWIVLTGTFAEAEAPGWRNLLPLVEKAWFGPPERAFGHAVTGKGGALLAPDGGVAVFPWQPGELFHQYGSEDYKFALTDVIDLIAPEVRVIRTDAHPSVELFWDKTGGHMLLQALNLSGFNGLTVMKPLPLSNVRVFVPFAAASARALSGGEVSLEPADGGCTVCIKRLERFEAVLLD